MYRGEFPLNHELPESPKQRTEVPVSIHQAPPITAHPDQWLDFVIEHATELPWKHRAMAVYDYATYAGNFHTHHERNGVRHSERNWLFSDRDSEDSEEKDLVYLVQQFLIADIPSKEKYAKIQELFDGLRQRVVLSEQHDASPKGISWRTAITNFIEITGKIVGLPENALLSPEILQEKRLAFSIWIEQLNEEEKSWIRQDHQAGQTRNLETLVQSALTGYTNHAAQTRAIQTIINDPLLRQRIQEATDDHWRTILTAFIQHAEDLLPSGKE